MVDVRLGYPVIHGVTYSTLNGDRKIPEETAWLRTYCSYTVEIINESYLRYKNLGMLLGLKNYEFKPNLIQGYTRTKVFKCYYI